MHGWSGVLALAVGFGNEGPGRGDEAGSPSKLIFFFRFLLRWWCAVTFSFPEYRNIGNIAERLRACSAAVAVAERNVGAILSI